MYNLAILITCRTVEAFCVTLCAAIAPLYQIQPQNKAPLLVLPDKNKHSFVNKDEN